MQIMYSVYMSFVMPPPLGGGGIMFLGCQYVRVYVRPYVHPYVRTDLVTVISQE